MKHLSDPINMKLETNQFQCAKCGEIYEKGWSDQEALEEAKELWTPEEVEKGLVVICDNCFNKYV